MTEKRFTVPVKYRFSHSKIQLNGEPLTNDELVRILNTNDGAFVENFALKQKNEQLKQSISDWRGSYDELYEDVTRLEKENEQLKKLNIPIEDVKEFVQDCKGRIIGVYYND